jgi:hypothetical protein
MNMSKTEESILAKLQSEGLSLDSPREEIMRCMSRCIGATKLMGIADRMRYDYIRWQEDDTMQGVYEGGDD